MDIADVSTGGEEVSFARLVAYYRVQAQDLHRRRRRGRVSVVGSEGGRQCGCSATGGGVLQTADGRSERTSPRNSGALPRTGRRPVNRTPRRPTTPRAVHPRGRAVCGQAGLPACRSARTGQIHRASNPLARQLASRSAKTKPARAAAGPVCERVSVPTRFLTASVGTPSLRRGRSAHTSPRRPLRDHEPPETPTSSATHRSGTLVASDATRSTNPAVTSAHTTSCPRILGRGPAAAVADEPGNRVRSRTRRVRSRGRFAPS